MRTGLNGYVVSDDDASFYRFFGYSVTSPSDIRDALVKTPEGDTLTLEVNSPGGSMFAGHEIYCILRGASCPTIAEVQSLAASAASVGALGADRVLVSPVAQFMIHPPSLSTDGNAEGLRQEAAVLDQFTVSILNAYELKCKGKKTRAELLAMMQAETWMPAQEALAAGFADGLLYDEGGVLASQVINGVGAGIRALASAGGMPDIVELRQRKAAAEKVPQPTGLSEADKEAAARLTARLNLEKHI